MVCARMSRLTGPLGFSAQVLPRCSPEPHGYPRQEHCQLLGPEAIPLGPQSQPPPPHAGPLTCDCPALGSYAGSIRRLIIASTTSRPLPLGLVYFT